MGVEVDLPDPCEFHEYPKGEVCVGVASQQLLQLPVAHCIENKSHVEEGECVCVCVYAYVCACMCVCVCVCVLMYV